MKVLILQIDKHSNLIKRADGIFTDADRIGLLKPGLQKLARMQRLLSECGELVMALRNALVVTTSAAKLLADPSDAEGCSVPCSCETCILCGTELTPGCINARLEHYLDAAYDYCDADLVCAQEGKS